MKELRDVVSTMLLNSTYCIYIARNSSHRHTDQVMSVLTLYIKPKLRFHRLFSQHAVPQPGHCVRLINNSYFLTIRMNHYENRYFRKIASKSLFKTMPYKDMYILKSFCKMLTYSVLIFINCFYGNWCFLKRDIMYMTKFRVIKLYTFIL